MVLIILMTVCVNVFWISISAHLNSWLWIIIISADVCTKAGLFNSALYRLACITTPNMNISELWCYLRVTLSKPTTVYSKHQTRLVITNWLFNPLLHISPLSQTSLYLRVRGTRARSAPFPSPKRSAAASSRWRLWSWASSPAPASCGRCRHRRPPPPPGSAAPPVTLGSFCSDGSASCHISQYGAQTLLCPCRQAHTRDTVKATDTQAHRFESKDGFLTMHTTFIGNAKPFF